MEMATRHNCIHWQNCNWPHTLTFIDGLVLGVNSSDRTSYSAISWDIAIDGATSPRRGVYRLIVFLTGVASWIPRRSHTRPKSILSTIVNSCGALSTVIILAASLAAKTTVVTNKIQNKMAKKNSRVYPLDILFHHAGRIIPLAPTSQKIKNVDTNKTNSCKQISNREKANERVYVLYCIISSRIRCEKSNLQGYGLPWWRTLESLYL